MRFFIVGLLLSFSLSSGAELAAQNTHRWTSPAGPHDWENDNNWDLGKPGQTDNALFDVGGQLEILLNQDEQIQFFRVRMGTGSVLLAGGNQLELFEESVIETGTLTMHGANLLSGNDLIIGEGGTANFQLSSATATNRDAILGFGGGTGSATVGSTSAWTNRNLFLGNTGSGFNTGTGHLNINAGGRVTVGGAAVNFDGYGLVIRATSEGSSEDEGNLLLRNGSTVHVDERIRISTGGLLSLHGANSRLTTDSLFEIRDAGEFHISGGASSTSDSGLISGRTNILGAGSHWEVANQISVSLDGLLYVSDGGLVEANRVAIGNSSFGTGTVAETRVTGVNSRLNVDGQLAVGTLNDGSLFIEDGGSVSASDLSLGPGSQGSGSVTVDGDGSQLNLATINGIVRDRRGSIHVRNGGTLNTGTAIFRDHDVYIDVQDASFSVMDQLLSEAHILIQDQGQFTADRATITGSGSLSIVGAESGWFSRNLFLNTTTGTDDDGDIIGARVSISNAGQLVVGNDDVINSTESLIISDRGTDGNLVLRNGATFNNDADTVIGLNAGGIGQATIDGFFKNPDTSEIRDTQFHQQGMLTVGEMGDGFLQISNEADAAAEDIVLANQTGSLGSVTINGEGSTLTATRDLTVGRHGNAGLFVQDGAVVSAENGLVGAGDSGFGEVSITGEGSSFNASRFLIGTSDGTDDQGLGNVSMNSGGRLLIGNDFSASPNSELLVSDTSTNAELVLRNGSTLTNSGIAVVGNSANAQGSVLLSGANSRWTNSDDVAIGLDGVGSLRIENGAELNADQNASIAENADSTGTVVVTGSDSQLIVGNGLSIGNRGQGSLTVEDQGLVVAPNVNVGFHDSGTSQIRINGMGSELRSETSLNIGGGGQSALIIDNGGLALSGQGNVSNSQSTAIVSGAQSRWLNTDALTVGPLGNLIVEKAGFVDGGNQTTIQADGRIDIRGANSELATQVLTVGADATQAGTIFVENGGKLSSSISNVGHATQTSGLVVVRGTDSIWQNSSLNVGATGGGDVKILAGGTIESGSGFIGRNGSGSFDVNGTGSNWDVSQQILVGWGSGGEGFLSVGLGGQVETLALSVGDADGSVGFLEVTGNSSQLRIDQSLSLGQSGFGSMQIANEGFVVSDFATMGATSTGTAQATVSTQGFWQINSTLRMGSFGTSNLTLESGGQVKVGSDGNGRTYIDEFGSVELNGGIFDFGISDLQSLGRISGTSGSLIGAVEFAGYNHISTFALPDLANLDTSGVRIANAGVIHGDGTTSFGLQNQMEGEVRIRSDQWMRFGGVGNRNSGEINNFGGLIEFESDLTNLDTGFIGGRGQFIAGAGIVNEGVMAFSGGNSDILGDIANQTNGQIVTSGLGITTFFDDVIHNGNEIRTAEGSATVFLGEFSGAGSFTGTGSVFFEGDLRPGNSPDIVSFAGDVILGSTSRSIFELSGTELGSFDQLQIAGDVYLDGELEISLIQDFELGFNQEFMILDIGGDRFGQFDGFSEGSLVGNFSGQNLYISYARGDGNGVSLFTAVPEPSGMLVTLLAIGWFGFRRRRNFDDTGQSI